MRGGKKPSVVDDNEKIADVSVDKEPMVNPVALDVNGTAALPID